MRDGSPAAEAAARPLRLKPRLGAASAAEAERRVHSPSVLAFAVACLITLPSVRLSAQTTVTEARDVVAPLLEAYGPSGHEGPVRDLVLRMLPAWATPQTVTLSVPGMTCATCPITVKAALMKVNGVVQVKSDLAKRQATVTFDDSKTDVASLSSATTNAGYPSGLVKAK